MPPTSQADDELLRPTLSAADDPAHMRAAWNPWTLAALAMLGGPLTAGLLFAENARRLGRKEHSAAVLGAGLALAVVSGFLVARLAPMRTSFEDWDPLTFKLVRGIATLIFVAPLATVQGHRFRVFTGSGGEPGKLIVWGLVAVLGAGTLGHAIAYGVMKWAS